MDGLNMRKKVLHHASERLLRHSAVILLAGVVAGCSGDMTRFTDGLTTGSTNNQRAIMQSQNQSYQQNNGADNYPSMPAAQRVASGNVQRNELPPVGTAAPMGAAQVVQNNVQNSVQSVRDQVTQQVAMAGSNMTNAAASSVNNAMVQPGETLYGVARRFNVSPNDLMAANNITDPNMLRAGQTLTIPGVKAAAGGALVAAANGGTQTLGQLKSNGTQAVANAQQAATNKVNNAVANAGAKVAAATGGYTVQSGDTLHAIAQRNGVTAAALKQANGMSDGTIRVGQSLVIPVAATAAATQVAAVAKPVQAAVDTTVKTASTPPAAAKQVPDGSVKPYTPPQASNKVIEEAEQDVAMAPSATGISQMRWPVRGKVLTSFGQRDGGTVNDGIDIMVPEGTPVKAAENGVVIYAGDGLKEFGQTVLVRHENGLVTVYGHNSKINVQRGQKVRRGEEIARSGMSGNAKSPKLHFEVRKNSTPVNPSKYLET
ncbi:LysM peptidoglycan-binding domain-containing protein [Pseudochrobactrum sp. Wa41.01b-1]|nr:LysM peptidoglycan-binding domain-containing protein [Pseudochrobactrum sp. Wa41.01b-1]QYM73547.1 LysM peptidoglycan-binding domain-containing protein [Pseudochrobactrum sp. Wa41.01b-1]